MSISPVALARMMQISAGVSITLNSVVQSVDCHASRRLRVVFVASKQMVEWPARNSARTMTVAIAQTNGSVRAIKRSPCNARRMESGFTTGNPNVLEIVVLPDLGNPISAISVFTVL